MGDTEYNPLRCEDHDRDLDTVVGRMQKMVDEYHATNVTLTGMQGRLDMIAGRVPVDLQQQLIALTIKHDTLHRDFTALRNQWYYLIGLICTGFVTGLIAFTINGGMKP